jgi:hypothetical protein
MPEMSILRKSDLSLYLYLKDTVLKDFIEVEEQLPLQLMPELSDLTSYVYQAVTTMDPIPTDPGRGWVYFDTVSGTNNCTPFTSVSGLNGDGNFAYGIPEQSERVVVYETVAGTLNTVPWTDYMIDYMDGRIVSSRALEIPYVTYYWNYVSVVDEWAAIEAAEPPVCVLDIHGTDTKGYELGGGKKVIRKADIHIFASDPAERNDLIEILYDGLYNRSCPLYDFVTGSVLDYDGTFYGRRGLLDRIPNPTNKLTYLLDRETISNVGSLYFDNVTSRNINLPVLMSQSGAQIVLSDLNAYRSKISFDLIIYDDRNI